MHQILKKRTIALLHFHGWRCYWYKSSHNYLTFEVSFTEKDSHDDISKEQYMKAVQKINHSSKSYKRTMRLKARNARKVKHEKSNQNGHTISQ